MKKITIEVPDNTACATISVVYFAPDLGLNMRALTMDMSHGEGDFTFREGIDE